MNVRESRFNQTVTDPQLVCKIVTLLSTPTTVCASITEAVGGVRTNSEAVGTRRHTQLALHNIRTFYEQLLSVAAQQGARQEGCKVHKGLSQQGRHLLQGSLQLCSDAVKEKTLINRKVTKRN